MLTILFVASVGMFASCAVIWTTGYLPHDWQWWVLMVPASWVFTAAYHMVERRAS